MRILKRELRAGLKTFLFWSLGLFVLVFIGVTKYTGIEAGGEGVYALINTMPKIVLAVFGMAGVDIGSLGGFYAVLVQYAILLTAVYAAWLGHTAVTKEAIDKTYEFLFTKPRSRSWFLSRKLLAGGIYMTAFSLLTLPFSASSIAILDIGETAAFSLLPFAAAIWLVGLTFFSLGAVFAAAVENAETGARLGNAAVLTAYAIGIAYDMTEAGGILRFFTPFRYFLPSELLGGQVDALFVALCIALSAIAFWLTFRLFEKRDLNAL